MSAENLEGLKDRHGLPHALRSCHTAIAIQQDGELGVMERQ